MELDELHKTAMAAFHAQRRATPAKQAKPSATAPETSDKYSNPANWVAGHAITLLHADTDSLLGVFVEWLHVSDKSARRLLPPAGPVSPSRTERISSGWLPSAVPAGELARRAPEHQRITVISPVALEGLGVHSPLCELAIVLQDSYLLRVETLYPEEFGQLPGRPDQLLHLPARVNILPLLSLESKIALRAEALRKE